MSLYLLINYVLVNNTWFLLFYRNKPELENPYMFSNIEVENTAMDVQESHAINPLGQIDVRPQVNGMPQNSTNQTNNSNSVTNVTTVSITPVHVFSFT